jgi:hypothetical protein
MELEAGDTLILSARVIPGNEEAVERLLERLRERAFRRSLTRIQRRRQPVHASGHPCADELAAMYRWLRPRLAVPVHGEQRHMLANASDCPTQRRGLALTGRTAISFISRRSRGCAGAPRLAPRAGTELQDHEGEGAVDDHDLGNESVDKGLGMLGLEVDPQVVVEQGSHDRKEKYRSRAEQLPTMSAQEVQERRVLEDAEEGHGFRRRY